MRERRGGCGLNHDVQVVLILVPLGVTWWVAGPIIAGAQWRFWMGRARDSEEEDLHPPAFIVWPTRVIGLVLAVVITAAIVGR
jgi:hypothetical protein